MNISSSTVQLLKNNDNTHRRLDRQLKGTKKKKIFCLFYLFCVTKHTERGHYGPAKRQQGCKMARNMYKKREKREKNGKETH